MEQAKERVHAALERVAWKWAEEDRIPTRRESTPVVVAVMERVGYEATVEATERCIAEFCEMVVNRKRALIEVERLENLKGTPVPARRARP